MNAWTKLKVPCPSIGEWGQGQRPVCILMLRDEELNRYRDWKMALATNQVRRPNRPATETRRL